MASVVVRITELPCAVWYNERGWRDNPVTPTGMAFRVVSFCDGI